MGSDTLPARSDGQTITSTWFNILRTILIGDLVPRNASGSAESAAGNLGTDTYRYMNSYLAGSGSAMIGNASTFMSGTKLATRDSATGSAFIFAERMDNINNLISLTGVAADKASFESGFTGTIIGNNKTTKEALQNLETEVDCYKTERIGTTYIDAEATWGNDIDTYTSMVVIIPTGKKVLLRAAFESKAVDNYRLRWYRDSTELADYTYTGLRTGYTHGTNGSNPDIYASYIDNPGAGTYTYYLKKQRGGASPNYTKGLFMEVFLIPA